MGLVYFLLWLILNGRVTAEAVGFGVVVAVLLSSFSRRVLNVRSLPPAELLRRLPAGLLFTAVLIRDILRSNLQVIRLVLSPVIEVEPCLIRFRTDLGTDGARVALANSITLTPGTLTVSLEGDELLVHALDREMAHGLADSDAVRLLHLMEGGRDDARSL